MDHADELKELKLKVDEIHKAIVGNIETDGILTRLSHVERTQETAKWWIRTIVVALMGVVVKLFWNGASNG